MKRISTQFNLLNQLQPILSARLYLSYAQPFLHCITKHFSFDDGSQFKDAFVEVCEIHDVEWKSSGTQHNIALGVRQRRNGPVRRRFQKLRINQLKLKREFLQNVLIKACNDALGPE